MHSPTQAQAASYRALIAKWQPEMQRAFADAVASMRGALDWRGLVAALEAGDIEAAIAAIGIDAGDFLALWQAANNAYIAGATATVSTLAVSGVGAAQAAGIRFDMTNPRAEAYLTVDSARMVQEIADDTREALRETILSGYQAGRGPREIATDIAGRAIGGRRQGGVVGLDAQRARSYSIVTRGMETPEGVRDLVIMGRDGVPRVRYVVNPATERQILAAYRKGGAVPLSARRTAENQYYNALLKSRGDTIARTETGMAVAAGRREEWVQVLEKLGRSREDVIKTWQAGSGGKDPRPYHQAMNGKSVRGMDTPFVFGNGATLQCAHDPDGAASEVINCTCSTAFRLAPRREDLA